jgi:hypothetical protein
MSTFDELLHQQGFDDFIDGCWDEKAQRMEVYLHYMGEWIIRPKATDSASMVLALAEDFEERARQLRAELAKGSLSEETGIKAETPAGR